MSTKKAPTKWTPELIEELKSAYDAGMSYADMGVKFGIQTTSVHSIVGRYHPNKKPRGRGGDRTFFPEEKTQQMLKMYEEGHFLKDIAVALNVSGPFIDKELHKNRVLYPQAMHRLKVKRTKALAERGLNNKGMVVDLRKHKTVTNIKKPAYTDLDRAIDFLRKWTGVWLEKDTGKVVYGCTRKTPDEIIALAKRKGLVLEGGRV